MAVIRDFFEEYPFLDLELHPLENETLVKRVQDEARSGLSNCDVLLAGGGIIQRLLDEKLVVSYRSPQRKALSEALNDTEGFWTGYYINPIVLGYSKALVKEEEIPKTFKKLLEPRWRGSRIAIDSTAFGLLRGLGSAWGDEKAISYLKNLAEQNPIMARASIAAVDRLHMGDVSMVIARAPVISSYKDKFGSHINWTFLDPTIAQIEAVMLSANSSRPNAARLFVDFIVSRQGQSAFAAIQQIPVRKDMTSSMIHGHNWFIERPDKNVNFQETVRLFREIFRIQ
jgi:iron(III) transport system substrate-binding protein